jgi:hypothetical protein
MKTISPRDASLLALLAEKPGSKSAVRRRVLRKLNPEAFSIAVEIGKKSLLPRSGSNLQSKASETARGLENWATTNKRSSRSVARKRRAIG